MDEAFLYLVTLRVQLRDRPEARAIIDRCLSLLTRARTADAETAQGLDREVDVLREELAARFGPAGALRVH